MGARESLRDADAPTALGGSRARVLALLQESDRPLSVSELAEQVTLHPNTVRFHLDGLVEAGTVERTVEDRDQPGRPRTLYSARPDSARAGQRSYRLLAEILASFVAAETPQPAQAATRAGRAWGRYLAERPAPFQRVDADSASAQLVATLDDIGFAPESVTTGRRRRILLHHCPFREAAEQHRDVVCAIHLGLMQGVLGEIDAPLTADRLDPFVEPSLCVAHLTAGKAGSAGGRKRRGTSR
jgi:predicted ArsR family transcriptional regulator